MANDNSPPPVYEAKLEELTPDEHNANQGTIRGQAILDHSLRQFGAGRSILVDRNGRVIAGNKTLETAASIGLDQVVVVETDGSKLVAVKRTDLDLEDGEQARLLAYADNRAGEVGLDWDAVQVHSDIAAGLDLTDLFSVGELETMIGTLAPVVGDLPFDESFAGEQRGGDGFVTFRFGDVSGIAPRDVYERFNSLYRRARQAGDIMSCWPTYWMPGLVP